MQEHRFRTFVEDIIIELGFYGQENFDDTPDRVVNMWHKFMDYPTPKMTAFPLVGKAGMIVLKDHICWGFCPHHLLPVKYKIKVGYIPKDKVLGASKPLRVAEWVLRRLPLQEEIGQMISDVIVKAIDPRGVGVIVSGEHLCMQMRGIESPCSSMVTTFLTGCFLEEGPTREEFMLL